MSSWRPAANLATLQRRATLLHTLRSFFAERDILEVETPALCSSGVTDPAIEPLIVPAGEALAAPRYLQSSPEYAMKRLLVAFNEPIYQISRVFRDGEVGAQHNPEFTLLEWYRPGFTHHDLMDEVEQLLARCMPDISSKRMSYRELFATSLGLDPFTVPVEELAACARGNIDTGQLDGDRDVWLDLLLSHVIQPQLAQDKSALLVYNYPPSQAALARIVEEDEGRVAQRFELFVSGVELANGYCELTDAREQEQRFLADNRRRKERGQAQRPVDTYFLEAMSQGLPFCSGVALGVDRLLMLSSGLDDIRELLAFPWADC